MRRVGAYAEVPGYPSTVGLIASIADNGTVKLRMKRVPKKWACMCKLKRIVGHEDERDSGTLVIELMLACVNDLQKRAWNVLEHKSCFHCIELHAVEEMD